MGHARHRHRDDPARLARFRRAVVHRHHLFIVVAGILLSGPPPEHGRAAHAEPLRTIIYTIYFIIPHLELFDVRERVVYDWGR